MDDKYNQLPDNQLDLSKKHYDTEGAFINNEPILKNISKNIQDHVTTDAYIKLQNMKTKGEHKLHSAQPTKKANDEGAYVFEFRTAGSGNNQWNKIYRGFNGHNEDVRLTPKEKEDIVEEKSYYDEIAYTMKQKYHLDFNGEIDEKQMGEKLEQEYGRPLYVKNSGKDKGKLCTAAGKDTKMLSGVRIKNYNNKTVANLSGPLGTLFGMGMGNFDTGDYSINNLKDYMLQLADEWLDEVVKNKEKTGDNKPVYFYMQGHSRGGVATAEASAMIEHLIETKYKDLKDQIHVDVRLFDPVPGTDSHSNHHTIDHNKKDFTVYGNREAGGVMNEEGKQRNDLTVLYSMHSNHDTHFKPMKVLGAKRVILSPRDHDMGIYDVAGEGQNLHKKGFINGTDGEEYRGTGIHELKEGLFVLDENNILVEIKNRQEAHNLLDSLYKDKSDYWQRTRHNTMYDVVDEWFTRHKEEITPKDTRYAPREAVKEDLRALKSYLENKNDLADAKGMKSRVMASLFAHFEIYSEAKKDPLRFTQSAFDKYKKMTADMENIYRIQNNPRFENFINNLSDDKIQNLIDNPNGSEIIKEFNNYSATALPESGLDQIDRNLGEAQQALKTVLNAEISDNPDEKLADPEGAKKMIVAHIFVNRIVNEIAKKDPEADTTASKEKYTDLIKQAESQVGTLLNDQKFNDFFEKMKSEDFYNLARGNKKEVGKIYGDYQKSKDDPAKESNKTVMVK